MTTKSWLGYGLSKLMKVGCHYCWQPREFPVTRPQPRDPDLTARMMTVSPVISEETTMWKTWVGFNATHSFGLILFGAIYGYLAICHSAFLFRSRFLLALGFTLLLGYAVIARLYFFTAPFRGVVLAAVLYLIGIIVKRV